MSCKLLGCSEYISWMALCSHKYSILSRYKNIMALNIMKVVFNINLIEQFQPISKKLKRLSVEKVKVSLCCFSICTYCIFSLLYLCLYWNYVNFEMINNIITNLISEQILLSEISSSYFSLFFLTSPCYQRIDCSMS